MITSVSKIARSLVLLSTAAHAANIGSHNDVCFDASISNNQLYNGAASHLWQCAASWNQNWDIGNYGICLSGVNKCIDVKDGDGYHTQIWDRTGGRNQRFSYKNNGQFEWADTGRCLTIPDYQYHNGVGLVLDLCSKQLDSQVFSYGGVIGWEAVQRMQQQGSRTPPKTDSSVSTTNDWVKRLFPNGNKRLLAWGVYDGYLKNIIGGSKIAGLYHWADPDVPGNPKLFIPMYWGWAKKDKWERQLQLLGGSTPKMVLGFNEPDTGPNDQSAGMDARWSAELYKQEIHDRFANKGTVLVSPAVAWDYQGWLNTFMNRCNELGCKVDAIGYHIYLPVKGDVDGAVKEMKKRLEAVYAMYRKPIMLTELGITPKGMGNAWEIKTFLQKAANYLDNTDFIAAWAFSGCYTSDNPWDGGVGGDTAFFNKDGSITDFGATFAWG